MKILFEEISFKARFEGRVGRAVTERVKGFVQQRSKRHDDYAVFFRLWGCEKLHHPKKGAET